MRPNVQAFFDPVTATVTYLVTDPTTDGPSPWMAIPVPWAASGGLKIRNGRTLP